MQNHEFLDQQSFEFTNICAKDNKFEILLAWVWHDGGGIISDLIFGDLGLDFLKKLQEWSPDLDLLFQVITLFGETTVLIAVVASLYWVVNKRDAIGLAVVLAISGYINTLFKGIVGLERPFQSHPSDVKEIGSADGYSFPSGHSVATGSFWSYSALKANENSALSQLGKFSIYIIGILLVILVPLSRVYLGVHWPGDVLVGIIEGILIACMIFWGAPKAWPYLEQLSDRDQVISVVLITLLMACLSTIATSTFGNDAIIAANWELPGALAGFAIGLILEKTYLGFEVPRASQKKNIVLRLTVGLLLLIVFYYGLKIIAAPFEEIELLSGVVETSLALPFDYIRLFIIAFGAAFGIPWIFVLIERRLELDANTCH